MRSASSERELACSAEGSAPDADLARDWEPRSVDAGWEHWALVEPVKVLGRMNMRLHVERVTRLGVTVRVFDDPLAAEGWLDEPPLPAVSL